MNSEMLKKRIDELLKIKVNHEKMVLVVDGAIQDCEYWLKVIEEGSDNLIDDGEKT